MGFVTTDVDLGGGLVAVVRRPDMATWFEYEDLINGRFFPKTKEQEEEEKRDREEALIRAYQEREGSLKVEPDKPKERRTVIRKFTRDEARMVLEYVQGPFLRDALVRLVEGGETIATYIMDDGTKVQGEYDLRDLGPDRLMELAGGITEFVRGARLFSFRDWRSAQAGEGARVASIGEVYGEVANVNP